MAAATAAASASSSQSEFALNAPPADGISSLNFGVKSNDLLLVSSWDCTLRLYDVSFNLLRLKAEFDAPVLDCCFDSSDARAFAVGMDENVTSVDLATGQKSVLGKHAGSPAGSATAAAAGKAPPPASSCLAFHADSNTLLSGGWDGRLLAFDSRTSRQTSALTPAAGEKILTMGLSGSRIVLGTNRRQVFIYDLRKLSSGAPEQKRESSLLNQTRCIRGFPDTTGYALSSIEGRVAIEYFNPDPLVQANKYAFKCHRRFDAASGKNILYPVNAIAFHPRYGTFATGGCDGIVTVWDGANKKRICQYPAKPTSVAALAFSPNGEKLATAASYTFEEGEKDHPTDAIYIRTVSQHEVMPKQQRASGAATGASSGGGGGGGVPAGVFAQATGPRR